MSSEVFYTNQNEHRFYATRSSGNWMILYKTYHRIMTRLQSLFIQDLINLGGMKKTKRRKVDGLVYFQCTSRFLINSASAWTTKEIRRHLAGLAKLGYIKIKRLGVPPTRWIWIDTQGIEHDLHKAQRGITQLGPKGPNQDGPKGPLKNSRVLEKREERRTESAKAADSDPPTGDSDLGDDQTSDDDDGIAFGASAQIQKVNTTPPSEEDKDCATQLRHAIVKAGLATGGWSKKRWADEFRLLRQSVNDRCRKALDWLTSDPKRMRSAKKHGLPTITSAKQFRQRFTWIEEGMAKWTKENPTVEISEDAYKAAAWLNRHCWPGNCQENMAKAVQLSYDNLSVFMERIHSIRKSENHKLGGFVRDFCGLKLSGGVVGFVDGWFDRLWEKVREWEDWNANIISCAWSLDNKRAQETGRQWSLDYCGDTNLWDELMKEIGHDS